MNPFPVSNDQTRRPQYCTSNWTQYNAERQARASILSCKKQIDPSLRTHESDLSVPA